MVHILAALAVGVDGLLLVERHVVAVLAERLQLLLGRGRLLVPLLLFVVEEGLGGLLPDGRFIGLIKFEFYIDLH